MQTKHDSDVLTFTNDSCVIKIEDAFNRDKTMNCMILRHMITYLLNPSLLPGVDTDRYVYILNMPSYLSSKWLPTISKVPSTEVKKPEHIGINNRKTASVKAAATNDKSADQSTKQNQGDGDEDYDSSIDDGSSENKKVSFARRRNKRIDPSKFCSNLYTFFLSILAATFAYWFVEYAKQRNFLFGISREKL